MQCRSFPLLLVLIVSVFSSCDGRMPAQAPAIPQPESPVQPTPVAPPSPPSAPRPATTDPLNGDYTLTVDAGSGCDTVPEYARKRVYMATISSLAERKYVVTLSGERFLTGLICNRSDGLGCNGFQASREGDVTQFDLLPDEDGMTHGGYITEQLSDGSWVQISGEATGVARDAAISASGSASVWYCPPGRGYPFPCTNYTGCRTTDMRLTFTRR